mgnify:CR=1 FL=1
MASGTEWADCMVPGPKTIRGRVVLSTLCATTAVMLLLLAVASYGVMQVVRQAISDNLVERLDLARSAVERGDLASAVDSSGPTIVQVVGADGGVIMASENARGLAPLTGLAIGEKAELDDDVELELDDEDDLRPGEDEDAKEKRGEATEHEGDHEGGRERSDDADGQARDRDDEDLGERNGRVRDHDDADEDRTAEGSRAGSPALSLIAAAARATKASASPALSLRASEVLGVEGPFLAMEREATSPTHGNVTIVALTSIAPAVATGRGAALLLAAVFALLLVVVALFSWHMTERTLQPVERMRQSAEAITASDLSRRVSVPDGDRDLSRLARTFNDLLARIEAAMDAQRRFVSDASHELKGPVAATKIMLETARSHPEAVDPSTLLSDLANENEQLQGIVADLLALARQDEGRLQVNLAPLDLCDLIYEEVASLERRSAVSLDVSGVEPLVCAGDAQLLGQALRNLLENAVRYAHSHVAVTCHEVLGSTGRLIRISVSDDGPGIAPADRERVFGRFVRLGKDRGRATGGTGLGLAVVQGIVERHGGRVYFSDPEIGGATAVMELVGKAPARCE